jgi:AcrR family transcriptional regulator
VTSLAPIEAPADPLHQKLLEAAARVFAQKGYAGTKIHDIVREAGVSTGAVYGRFASKDALLREAVLAATVSSVRRAFGASGRVADLIESGAQLSDAPITVDEAVRIEALVAARREPEVAAAIADAMSEARAEVQPLVEAAIADHTVAAEVDPEAVLYLIRTVHLGLLLQRGAGMPTPDPAGWRELMRRVVASFGDDHRQEIR